MELYTKRESEKRLAQLGQLAEPGRFVSALGDTSAVSIGETQTKEADITYMPSVAAAKAYVARGVPTSPQIRMVRRRNAIIFLIQHRPGEPGPDADDVRAVEKCLA